MQGFALFATPIGPCGIAWSGELVAGVALPGRDEEATRRRMNKAHPGFDELAPPAFVEAVITRIRGVLEGGKDDLADVPLDLDGVPDFNRRVYAVARSIPPGRTLTYGEVAARIGEPQAAQAVGQALGHNPFAPVVPCHRVLAAGGRSGGFSAPGGVDTKLKMLEIERARIGNEAGLFD